MKNQFAYGIIVIILIFTSCKSHKASQNGNSNASLENTKWKLLTLDGETISTSKGGKDIYIMISENKLSGFSGCNGIGGNYKLNDNTLKFSGIISTKMACPRLNTENKFSQALEKTESYSIKGDILSLTSSDNSTITFKALHVK